MTDVSQRVVELFGRGRLPHGMLWIGLDLQAQKNAVNKLAQAIFCENRSPMGGCGVCSSCQKVERGHHPDLRYVSTEGKEIKIDSVRNLSRWVYIAPHEAPQKVGVIEGAELLNRSSSNALLKTLEEPPAHALMILLARSGSDLLPTIRSRLMPFRFAGASNETELVSARPPWGDQLEQICSSGKTVSPDEIFSLTEIVTKDKENLRWFFWMTQQQLRNQLAKANEEGNVSHLRRLESLFDLSISTERETLRRYGNTALGLDRFLTQWLA